MNGKYKIILSLSFALAIFYSLPWIALSENSRNIGMLNSDVVVRISYLFVTVFITSVFFFQYNFFWKRKLLVVKNMVTMQLLNFLFNILLVFIACGILVMIRNGFFNVGAGRVYFVFYLFRNTGIALIVMLVTYVIELAGRSRRDKIRVLTLQNQNSETELAALRSQIDPHFLFNSLTSLSGLIRANSKEALEFVNHLTETFRYILEKRQHKLVTVKDEIHFLESYIFMMEKRFVAGFQVILKIDEVLFVKSIPQFALQIAVENAMKHNLVSIKSPLTIEIYSSDNAIMVRNNIQKKKTIPGYGIGLANLSKRYQLMGDQDITIRRNEHHFEIYLPLL